MHIHMHLFVYMYANVLDINTYIHIYVISVLGAATGSCWPTSGSRKFFEVISCICICMYAYEYVYVRVCVHISRHTCILSCSGDWLLLAHFGQAAGHTNANISTHLYVYPIYIYMYTYVYTKPTSSRRRAVQSSHVSINMYTYKYARVYIWLQCMHTNETLYTTGCWCRQ